MPSDTDTAIDLERLELRLFPHDPPPSADLLVDADRLPYDLSAPGPSPAMVRVIERYGLPERPLVATREEGEGDEYQVLRGAAWVRAAREAGMDRIPVRVLELPDLQSAFLALVLNQQSAADVALQADALQALLEAGVDEQDLARTSGLGRGRTSRLSSLLELHPVLRQALREGCLRPQVGFAAARLSPESQDQLAAIYQSEGELTSAALKRIAGSESEPDGGEAAAETDAALAAALAAAQNGTDAAGDGAATGAGAETAAAARSQESPAARARRQAEELLRTLEQARIGDDIRQQVAEVIEQLGRIAV